MMKSDIIRKGLELFTATRKTLRPLPSAYYSMFLMIGYFYTSMPNTWVSLRTILLFISSSLMLGSLFGMNNIADAEDDKKNPRTIRHNPISAGEMGRKTAVLASSLAVFAGLTIYFFAFNLQAMALLLSLLFLGSTYSLRPIRLKERPPLDVLSHGLFFGSLPFLVGARLNGNLSRETLLLSVIFFNISVMYELWNEVVDYEYDGEAGVKTLAVIFGKRKIKVVLALLTPLNLLLGALSNLGILGFCLVALYTALYTLEMVNRETVTLPTCLLVFPTAVCIILKV